MKIGVVILTLILLPCFSIAEDSIEFYQGVLDDVYAAEKSGFDSMAASNYGTTYYTFQYVLDGTLCMYEATGDVKYLERALNWAETMVSKATIIDKNGNRNWAGGWTSNPYTSQAIAYQLDDFQGSTELARLARIILTDPSLEASYGDRAQVIYEFVRDEIIEKHMWVRGSLNNYKIHVLDRTRPMDDKLALAMRIMRDLYLIDGNLRYLDPLTQFAEGFKARFEPYQGALIWDKGLAWESGATAIDTSHANRYPYTLIDLYKGNIVFTVDYPEGVGRLVTDVIWNQDYDNPMFTNYIDGSNGVCLKRDPWGCGRIYSGCILLGEFDPEVHEIGAAVMDAMLANVRNPSMDYNNNRYGKTELAGHLALNLANKESVDTCTSLGHKCCNICLSDHFSEYDATCSDICCDECAPSLNTTVFSPVEYFGDSTNWQPGTESRWEVVDDGNLRYGLTTTDFSNPDDELETSIIRNKSYNNFIFTAKAKTTENLAVESSADYDIVFCWQGHADYHYIMFNSNPLYGGLIKLTNGIQEVFSTPGIATITDESYHDIRLEYNSPNVRVFVDSAMVYEVNVTCSGGVGIGSLNDAVLWDDINVQSLCTTFSDLIIKLDDWKEGLVTISELLETVKDWKSGCQ